MSTTRIAEKVSNIVRRQFPEHIQTDYNKFIEFVEAYYRFLEQDGGAQEVIQNAKSYNDVDSTTPAFLNYFLTQYAPSVPRSALANKPHLIKQLRSFYESKGSEASFKMLFRMLFDADIHIDYPFENVLRASNGEWLQRASVRVETLSGSTANLKNRFLTVVRGIQTYNTPINSTIKLTSTLTELYLDPAHLVEYEIGDIVTVSNGTSVIFTGRIHPTTATVQVLYGGKQFKAGQIFYINRGLGLATLVKVVAVSSVGAITSLKIINFGYGYTETFTTNLNPTLPVNAATGVYVDRLTGFGETISFLAYSPIDPNRYFLTDDYVEPTYYTDYVGINDDSYYVPAGSETGDQSENFASIKFTMGAIGRYPGTFITNKGFVSEEQIRLENNKQYKAFTYRTNTDVDLSVFFGVVKALVHPAGNDLYNNRIISSDVSVRSRVELVSNIAASSHVTDHVSVDDSVTLTLVP